MVYKILSNSDVRKLVEDVNLYLSEGWKLEGGVAVGLGEQGAVTFAQAITKE